MTTLTTNLNTVSSLLGTRASSALVTAALALKQDLIGDSLAIGALVIHGDSDAALVQHDGGVALQTSDGSLTLGVFTPAGATVRQLIVQEAIVVPDDSIAITKIGGLTAALAGNAANIETLTRKYDGKNDLIDETLTLSVFGAVSNKWRQQ